MLKNVLNKYFIYTPYQNMINYTLYIKKTHPINYTY